MYLSIEPFGSMPGRPGVYEPARREPVLYVLENSRGAQLAVTDCGARIVRLAVPDRDGNIGDVALGYSSIEPYLASPDYMGAICGRVCNRIAGGRFTLDGRAYHTDQNDGAHTLHGGGDGFDRRLWDAEYTADGLCFSLVSPDGDCGFPGTVKAGAVYRFGDDNTLTLELTAETDAPTPVSLTNHSYFNLSGYQSGAAAMAQRLTLFADAYTPVGEGLIPTGKPAPVSGTPFDFTSPCALGARVDADDPQLALGGGYDHNFALRGGEAGACALAARLYAPDTGRVLELFTTLPGLQLYTCNALGARKGKDGACYGRRAAVCLEPQFFPNAVNEPGFASPLVRPGEVWRHSIEYRFTCE